MSHHVVRHFHQRTRDTGMVAAEDIEDGLSLADDQPYREALEEDHWLYRADNPQPLRFHLRARPRVLDSLTKNALRVRRDANITVADRIIALAMVG